MAQQIFDHGLNAKIPGQSLTMAPGSMPMEKPPLFTDPAKASQYFWDQLHKDKKTIIKLVVLLRKGVPAEYIARTILFTAIANGIIHINTGLLILRILVKQIAAIGMLKGVKPLHVRNPDLDLMNFVKGNKDFMYNSPSPQEPDTTNPIKSGLLAMKGTK